MVLWVVGLFLGRPRIAPCLIKILPDQPRLGFGLWPCILGALPFMLV